MCVCVWVWCVRGIQYCSYIIIFDVLIVSFLALVVKRCVLTLVSEIQRYRNNRCYLLLDTMQLHSPHAETFVAAGNATKTLTSHRYSELCTHK